MSIETVICDTIIPPRMNLSSLLRWMVVVASVGLLASCEELQTAQQTAANAARTAGNAVKSVLPPSWYTAGGYWEGDDVPGSPRIVVRLSEQRAYFYKGRRLIGETVVSTGRKGFSTPPGRYTVLYKHRDHVSGVFGDYIDDAGNIVKFNIDVRKDAKPPGTHFDGARMPYAMFFRGGYAMHQGYVPPYAASHGCIRLPRGMAEHFYSAAREGTPVIVKE